MPGRRDGVDRAEADGDAMAGLHGDSWSVGPSTELGGFEAEWEAHVYRTGSGTPIVPAEFVAAQGPAVRIIDVRDPQEFIGPMGYIPGSEWIPPERLDSLPGRLGRDAMLVVVSRHGDRASEVARRLAKSGMRYAGAMAGGVSQWLSLGFGTTRDPAILDRCDLLREEPAPAAGAQADGLTIEQVEEHLGNPSSVRWVKLAALILHAQLSCIDGRDDRGIMGTPGGDAGQFLLALAAIESVIGRPLDDEAVATLLDRRIDALGGFYMHTDHAALMSAVAAMRSDPRLADAIREVDEPAEWRQFLRRPPLVHREAVLDHLLATSSIGCGHIRLMSQHSEAYQVRPGLVRALLRSFFHARWDGAFRADYESLAGKHGERAVLNTRIDGRVQPFSMIPLVSPSYLGSQMFVNHPQVGEYLLGLLIDFLLLQDDVIPEFAIDRRAELLAAASRIGAAHVTNSLGHLAKGLPIYDVTFTSPTEFVVKQTGLVG